MNVLKDFVTSPPEIEPFAFGVVPGRVVHEILTGRMAEVVDLVSDVYLAHRQSLASNPPSSFLTFSDRRRDRIVALPADLRDGWPVAGLKWISSWPENVESGVPRASAVLVLNRRDTGYPFAVLEASIISAVRTAGSAVLAAECLPFNKNAAPKTLRMGFVGCGFIARYILEMFIARQWNFNKLIAFDLVEDRARVFLELARTYAAPELARSHEDVIQQSDIVVFATTSTKPYVTDPGLFRHHPLVLHISLRDLSPNIILSANNIVDDVEHCLSAETSPHLAEQQVGNRTFVSGTIAEAIDGSLGLDPERATIVSPFGMGILDLAIGRFVYREARRLQAIYEIPNFFHDRGQE